MTRVIKVGGRAQSDPRLVPALARAWRDGRDGGLCIVHGGGDEISTLQRALGIEPTFVDGRRATTERDVDLVRMVLSGTANKRLVAALVSAGVSAVGVSGEDAALLVAKPDADARLGRVGAPHAINVGLLWHLLDGNYLPVISPVGRAKGTDGVALNVNGDDAAAAIAVALGAEELLFVADVSGVLVQGKEIDALDTMEAAELIAHGIAQGGMAAKLRAASAALDGGVPRVRISDVHAVTDLGRGTILNASPTPTKSLV
ncbi:MAG: acetylglutamate kinase [Gemmatimonadota bacterium]|nr:acetylglutamate kinase [Gemmatimonadota bacterium]